jgi:hypothetical protein
MIVIVVLAAANRTVADRNQQCFWTSRQTQVALDNSSSSSQVSGLYSTNKFNSPVFALAKPVYIS